MNTMNEIDAALNSIVIRVAIPVKDITKVIHASDELEVTILELKSCKENAEIVFVEFYLKSAFNLYALGKMVAYNEFLNDKK